MAKVVVGKLNGTSKASSRSGASVTTKRVRDEEGRIQTLRTLDANSDTFGADLQYVFGKNVEKARRENGQIAGTTNIAPAKS